MVSDRARELLADACQENEQDSTAGAILSGALPPNSYVVPAAVALRAIDKALAFSVDLAAAKHAVHGAIVNVCFANEGTAPAASYSEAALGALDALTPPERTE